MIQDGRTDKNFMSSNYQVVFFNDQSSEALELLNSLKKTDIYFSELFDVNKFEKFFLSTSLNKFIIPVSLIREQEKLLKSNKFKHVILSYGRLDANTNYQKMAKDGCLIHFNHPLFEDEVIRIKEKFLVNDVNSIDLILELISNLVGVNISGKNEETFFNRIEKRAREVKLKGLNEYFLYFLEYLDQEVAYLISNLTTHTTSFFREPLAFENYYTEVFPKLIKLDRPLFFWSAACSTGEELYSVCISFMEYCQEHNLPSKVLETAQFIGSDIDPESIKTAKNGVYLKPELQQIPESLIQKYFDIGVGDLEGYYRIKDNVHKLCEFKEFNLLSKNFGLEKFDFILLRHSLIYFKDTQANNILNNIEHSLKENGYLGLSFSESNYERFINLSKLGNCLYKKAKKVEIIEKVETLKKTKTPSKVLVIDDNKFIRNKLKSIFEENPEFQFAGEAENPIIALRILESQNIDLITLDINMPVMDGLTFLDKMNKEKKNLPPVIIVSSVDLETAEKFFNMNDLPFFEFLEKPSDSNWNLFKERLLRISKLTQMKFNLGTKRKFAKSEFPKVEFLNKKEQPTLVAIGCSTGGVEALDNILPQFPTNSPPLVIAQHMPAIFTQSFAKRLDQLCDLNVVEAKEGLKVESGHAYICPGGKNMEIKKIGPSLLISLIDEPTTPFIPSVDCLFKSLVTFTHSVRVVPIILTGMGNDGADGIKSLRDQGHYTLAQDKDTCVVYGMPHAALEANGVSQVAPLNKIVSYLFNFLDKK